MAENSKIEWTDHTFNPWIGCTKVSPGCDNCFAEKQNNHWKWAPNGWGAGQARRRTSTGYWHKPSSWNRKVTEAGERAHVFCGSLCDVFDAEVPDEWRRDLWVLIRDTPHLDWLLLTKRPNLIARYLPSGWGAGWPNVWLGVSVENQDYHWRVDALRGVPAAVRFLSVEPLLGPVTLNLAYIDWVIVGGESGSNARPMHIEWASDLVEQCQQEGVSVFVKQLGSAFAQQAGGHPKGGNPELWPANLRVREWRQQP